MQQPSVLVIGASLNPVRYSNLCIRDLVSANIPVEAIGLREGFIYGVPVKTGKPEFKNIHTVTLYLGAAKQADYYEYLLQLKPVRVIFNPGAENEEFKLILEHHNIDYLEVCSIMMLHSGSFF